MTFKSAYIRLTFFYVFIVMIISVAFSLIIYELSYQELGRGLGKQVRTICDHPNGSQQCAPPMELERIRLAQLDESRGNIVSGLVYFNVLILVLSSAVSYLLAKRTLQPIEQMMEAQNRFTADASHELKTPLTAIRSEIEVNLRDGKMSLSEAKKLLASNLEEVSKLESLSNALLKLAKYQEEVKKDFSSLQITEVVTEAYEKVEPLAKAKKIEFQTEFVNSLVLGDRQSLVELFVILFDNAIKYSPKNSKIVLNIKQSGKHVIVKIKDHGVGIDKNQLPHIFDRFYRADDSRNKDRADGYGLGLSIAKNIVEMHNADIEVQSEVGKGSTFTVKF